MTSGPTKSGNETLVHEQFGNKANAYLLSAVHASGADLDWLRDKLNSAGFAEVNEWGPAHFDEAIEVGVRSLQASHGLVPDGIVGPETLFALSARDDDGPRLRQRLQ